MEFNRIKRGILTLKLWLLPVSWVDVRLCKFLKRQLFGYQLRRGSLRLSRSW